MHSGRYMRKTGYFHSHPACAVGFQKKSSNTLAKSMSSTASAVDYRPSLAKSRARPEPVTAKQISATLSCYISASSLLTLSSDIIPANMSLATPSHAAACISGVSWLRVCLTSSTTWSACLKLAYRLGIHDELNVSAYLYSFGDQLVDIVHHKQVEHDLHDLEFELIVR
jgi:hypothetical protein